MFEISLAADGRRLTPTQSQVLTAFIFGSVVLGSLGVLAVQLFVFLRVLCGSAVDLICVYLKII
jgi:hypothetical protein